jgi:pyruvate/2-oxoacid:ferredoxin oxidoreductase alpha subunit
LKIKALAEKIKKFIVVEMSNGQMVDDVRLAALGKAEVEFYGRMGGNVPSMTELLQQTEKIIKAGKGRNDG